MLVNEKHLIELNKPIQKIRARVELYLGSALTSICNCGEILKDFTVERTGENKFFGFGICQKIHGNFIDLHKQIDISKDHTVEAALGVDEDFVYAFPKFYVQEFKRDEVSGLVTFTGYDILFKAENYTFEELPLPETYSVKAVAGACANILQVPLKFINVNDDLLNTAYTPGIDINFTGKESLRRVLDAIAEFTQTIYYINSDWELVFRRLNPADYPSLTVNGNKYVYLENGGDRRLKNIMSVTESEDNVDTVGEGEGVTQFIRENPFLTLRTDIASLLAQAQENVGGMTLAQFNMEWSGNYLLEIGDRIKIEAEDTDIYSYLLDDTLTFDGGLFQVTGWQFDENEGERASNPITIGEALNETYIKVDKVNKRIDMVVADGDATKQAIAKLEITTSGIATSVQNVTKTAEEAKGAAATANNNVNGLITRVESAETAIQQSAEQIALRATKSEVSSLNGKIEENTSAIAAININTESISNSIEQVQKGLQDELKGVEGDIEAITEKTETMITKDTFSVEISKVVDNGVKKVETSTGFTFNEEGLTIEKTNSDIKTQITEDGMKVYRNNTEVLTADNEGVKAEDLHATTYLMVGGRSRFENYESNRTACFWIGG